MAGCREAPVLLIGPVCSNTVCTPRGSVPPQGNGSDRGHSPQHAQCAGSDQLSTRVFHICTEIHTNKSLLSHAGLVDMDLIMLFA